MRYIVKEKMILISLIQIKTYFISNDLLFLFSMDIPANEFVFADKRRVFAPSSSVYRLDISLPNLNLNTNSTF